jgi:hypothetical protein
MDAGESAYLADFSHVNELVFANPAAPSRGIGEEANFHTRIQYKNY